MYILYDYVLDKYEFAIIDQIYDGLEALISIQEHTYDLVLLDVMLPNVGGFEICQKLREKSTTPVIMLSALSDEENQLKGYNLGIDEYITKPYSPKLVIKRLKQSLEDIMKRMIVILYSMVSYNII